MGPAFGTYWKTISDAKKKRCILSSADFSYAKMAECDPSNTKMNAETWYDLYLLQYIDLQRLQVATNKWTRFSNDTIDTLAKGTLY